MLWRDTAFRRRQCAFLALTTELAGGVSGHPREEVIAEFESAEAEWRAWQLEVERVAQLILAGRR